MIPDKPVIIACPSCKGLAKQETLMSGNTFGSTFYTDGKMISPMLPLPPPVVRCGHCRVCYWLSDAKLIGRLEFDESTPAEWMAAEFVEEPTETEYYESIAVGLARDPDEERNLRVLAWWRSNDAFRDPEKQERPPAPNERKANLEALLGFLGEESQNELLMKVELLRELGRFDLAQEMLNKVQSSELQQVTEQFRELCKMGDSTVRELKR